MAEHTAIEWCDATFNPWIGCTKVSPACDHCYAEADMDHRRHRVKWGVGQPRSRTSTDYWKKPLRWNATPFFECRRCGWRGVCMDQVNCPTCQDDVLATLKPARRRIFCSSLADVFDNEVDPRWRADLFELILATPNLDWLLLTKRIGNASPMLVTARFELATRADRAKGPVLQAWPWPNVWLGATICNQAEADRDIPKLLQVPAAVRFLSLEPLLGPVDLTAVHGIPHCAPFSVLSEKNPQGRRRCVTHADGYCMSDCAYRWPAVDWVIAGGESGTAARPMHPEWVRDLRDQCAAAGVPFLFKQWGEWEPRYYTDPVDGSRLVNMASTRDETVLGEPTNPSTYVNMVRVGKKRAGRLLDGVEHTAFPGNRP